MNHETSKFEEHGGREGKITPEKPGKMDIKDIGKEAEIISQKVKDWKISELTFDKKKTKDWKNIDFKDAIWDREKTAFEIKAGLEAVEKIGSKNPEILVPAREELQKKIDKIPDNELKNLLMEKLRETFPQGG